MSKVTATEAGLEAEAAARRFLEQRGFRLIDHNYRTRSGEIDLIMEQGSLLVFVEVRLRNNSAYGSGSDTVTRRKQQRVIRAAQQFLQRAPRTWKDYRFDVVSIGNGIDWIAGAFTLD